MTTRDVSETALSWVRCGVALRVVGLDRSARAMWLVWAPEWGAALQTQVQGFPNAATPEYIVGSGIGGALFEA